MSTINYTYNVIVDRFRQFAAGHFQLRRFTHGEISQADLEKEAEWPWLHVKPRAINYSPGTRSFSFEIFISDLPRDKEDKTGYQAESITDCSLIFQDLINEIYLGNMFGSDVVLTRPVNAEPFVEQYTHTLTGVTGTIELNLDYDWSACSIPASWNYNTPTDSPSDGWGALQFIESLDQNGVFVSLLNDVEAPGNSYYYGTNASGVKGWYAIVDNVGLTCETLPDCATIISIIDDIAALQSDVALKANTADLGATAFSNDYNDLDNLPTIPAAQVNSDWNATSGVAEILNKPTIPAQYNPTAGTGVSITGTYPNQTITNTAPDQVVALTAGTNIGVTGTYPNFTISNTQSLAGYVPTTRSITINGTTQDLSADRTFTIATGLTVGTTPITSGTVGRVLFEGTGNVLQESANLFWDNTNSRLGIGTASPQDTFTVSGQLGNLTSELSVINTNGGKVTFRAGVLGVTNSGFTLLTALQDGTSETARLAVSSNGNFLINSTTDAGFKLDVNGTARVQGVLTTTSDAVVNGVNIGIGGGSISTNLRFGAGALLSNTTGSSNTALGFSSLIANTSGIQNTSVGRNALVANTTGSNNTAIGHTALVNISNGSGNTALGALSGRFITDGTTPNTITNNSVFLGVDTRALANNQTNQIVIGYQAIGLGSNTTVLGNTSTTLTALYGAVITGGTSVNASAQLQVDSTTRGFLPPRMTTTQKNAIASPAAGLVVYDTTLNKLCVYTTAWETITSI